MAQHNPTRKLHFLGSTPGVMVGGCGPPKGLKTGGGGPPCSCAVVLFMVNCPWRLVSGLHAARAPGLAAATPGHAACAGCCGGTPLLPNITPLSCLRVPLHPAAQFVLTTDPSVGSLAEALQYIYASLFVELVAKNPLYTPGEPFL